MSRRRVDWSFGPGHGAISGVLNAAGGFLGATMVADLADQFGATFHPLWSLAAGTFAAGAAWLATRKTYQPAAVTRFRTACWLGGGCWSAWTLSNSLWSPGTPWSVPALASLGIGVLAAGITGSVLERVERNKEDAEIADARNVSVDEQPSKAEHEKVAAAWQALLRQITRRDVTVANVGFWEPNTGFTLDVDLPADGTTIDHIKPHEKALATSGNVPPGCAVEVLDSPVGRRQVWIRVGTIDALADDLHLPESHAADSVNNDLSMGVISDRTEATINLRYSCAVLVGQTDSGKSNQLNVITRRLAACTDTLIVAIDESGNGRFPRPWVRAWHEGRAEAPVIAAVAPNPLWSLLLTQSLIQIIDGRTARYGELMHREGSDKIMVRPELPQIILLVDEFGKLSDQVKDNIKTISDTGRGAAVRVVSCALEATATYIPRALIAQARERIAMRVSDESQIQYLFDNTWKSGRFDPKSLIHRGTGLWTSNGRLAEKFKGWRLEPAQIDADSIALANLRPDLDDISVELGDTVTVPIRDADGIRVQRTFHGVWTRHWEQVRPIMFPNADGRESAPSRSTITVSGNAAQSATEAPGEGLARSDVSLAEKLADAQRAADDADAGRDEPSDGRRGDPDDPLVAQLTEIVGAQVPPRRRMHQLMFDAGPKGVGPGPIHNILKNEGYDTAYQTLLGWMKADAAAGILAQPGGDKTPYFPGPKIGDPYKDDAQP